MVFWARSRLRWSAPYHVVAPDTDGRALPCSKFGLLGDLMTETFGRKFASSSVPFGRPPLSHFPVPVEGKLPRCYFTACTRFSLFAE